MFTYNWLFFVWNSEIQIMTLNQSFEKNMYIIYDDLLLYQTHMYLRVTYAKGFENGWNLQISQRLVSVAE